MSFPDDFSKGFVMVIVVFCIFAVIGFVVSCVTEIKAVFCLVLLIPLSIIMFNHWMNEKKERTQSDARAEKG